MRPEGLEASRTEGLEARTRFTGRSASASSSVSRAKSDAVRATEAGPVRTAGDAVTLARGTHDAVDLRF